MLFRSINNLEIVAEPGRYIAADYFDIYTPIIGKKIIKENDILIQNLYIAEGIYGAFSSTKYDAFPHFLIHSKNKKSNNKIYTRLWGQTCDSFDLIYDGLNWPNLFIDDLLEVKYFGAYTYSLSCKFNGFDHHKIFNF